MEMFEIPIHCFEDNTQIDFMLFIFCFFLMTVISEIENMSIMVKTIAVSSLSKF
jgi:hypothetical protein